MQLAQETICGLILQLRQHSAKESRVAPEPATHPGDTQGEGIIDTEVLQDGAGDDIGAVVSSEIGAMDEEQQRELLALFWIGRGEFTGEEFEIAKSEAADRVADDLDKTLLAEPLLADHLANGLAEIGRPCEF